MKFKLKSGLWGIVLCAIASLATPDVSLAQFSFPENAKPSEDPNSDITIDALFGPIDPIMTPPAAPRDQVRQRGERSRMVQRPAAAVQKPAPQDEMPRLTDEIPSASDMQSGRPSVSELRQARAMYRSQQRIQRLERNLWNGYEPLRPNWNSIPMMSSRYPYRNTVVVPIFVYPR